MTAATKLTDPIDVHYKKIDMMLAGFVAFYAVAFGAAVVVLHQQEQSQSHQKVKFTNLAEQMIGLNNHFIPHLGRVSQQDFSFYIALMKELQQQAKETGFCDAQDVSGNMFDFASVCPLQAQQRITARADAWTPQEKRAYSAFQADFQEMVRVCTMQDADGSVVNGATIGCIWRGTARLAPAVQ